MSTCAILAGLAGFGMAEDWSGTLLDADCVHEHGAAKACDAKRGTTDFILDVNGTKYKLDLKSNDGARSAMEARSDKASNPYATKAVPVTATIKGRVKDSGKIRADVIEVQ